MKTIPTTNGDSIIIDDLDYDLIPHNAWMVNPKGYPQRTFNRNGKRSAVKLHKILIQTDLQVDHINHNKLDNRRDNLRIVTSQENAFNRIKSPGTTSIYKGVTKRVRKNKTVWESQIAKDGKRIYIGRFKTEVEAAIAYDARATELFGKFACTNEMLLQPI